jgi:uncharacterized DUF497 family protein
MDPPATDFDWDHGNLEKCRQHGVATAEVEGMFRRLLWVSPDPAHSGREERFKAIGVDSKGRHVFVAFTLREGPGGALIRPISARYMHQKEVRHYESEKKKAEKAARSQNR